MGLLHLLVLKAILPGVRVAVVDPLEERLEQARELGADAAVRPEEARPAVERLSEGLGADAVFDTAGGAGPLAAALGLVRPGGTVVLFAHAGAGRARPASTSTPSSSPRRKLIGDLLQLARRAAGDLPPDGDPAARSVAARHPPAAARPASARPSTLARERRALKILLVPDQQLLVPDAEAS